MGEMLTPVHLESVAKRHTVGNGEIMPLSRSESVANNYKLHRKQQCFPKSITENL